MATSLTRLTFTVSEELESELKRVKEEKFSNESQSEMLRELMLAGLRTAVENTKERAQGIK